MTQFLLEAEQIAVKYPGGFQLGPINLSVQPGEIHAVLGENGSGKTTLLRALSLEVDFDGQLSLNGVTSDKISHQERAQLIAVVPQIEPVVFGFTIQETVLMARIAWNSGIWENERDLHIATESMEKAGIADLRDKNIGEVSGGQRQRCLIARALAQEPKILLLDEPTAYLDAKTRCAIAELLANLAKSGLAIILTSHDLQWAADIAHSVTLLQGGSIVAQGSAEQVLTQEKLNRVFGINFQILDQSGRSIFVAAHKG